MAQSDNRSPRLTQRLTQTGIGLLGRRGLAVQRHPATRRQAMLRLHDIDTVIDVGAARGGFAQELRAFGYAGRIISFEPMAQAHADLASAAAGDPSWTTINQGLGDRSGEQTIHIASNSDSSSLLPMAEAHTDAAPAVTYVGTEQVSITTLDEIAPTLLGDADRVFLKLDTQGFERAVLSGASATLPRITGLQLELSLTTLYHGGMLVDEAIGFAYDHGFELTSLSQGFTSPTGRMLQADGVFFRTGETSK